MQSLFSGASRNLLQYAGFQPAFFMPHRRSIGGIVAQVTIDEQASDDIQITEHPVEQGAPIADHAFKRPSIVTIRAGWSRQYAWDLSAESGVYGLLLSWQAALLPFDVITGKRNYTNMLIERLQVQTDQHSEFSLMATITCRQVILVSTSTTAAKMKSNSDGAQESPAKTGNEKDGGTKTPTETGTVSGYDPVTGNAPEQFGPPQPEIKGPVDPVTGNPITETASTPTAGAVENQMNANGAQAPNNPPVEYVDPFKEGF
jgi:hypothetical protein